MLLLDGQYFSLQLRLVQRMEPLSENTDEDVIVQGVPELVLHNLNPITSVLHFLFLFCKSFAIEKSHKFWLWPVGWTHKNPRTSHNQNIVEPKLWGFICVTLILGHPVHQNVPSIANTYVSLLFFTFSKEKSSNLTLYQV